MRLTSVPLGSRGARRALRAPLCGAIAWACSSFACASGTSTDTGIGFSNSADASGAPAIAADASDAPAARAEASSVLPDGGDDDSGDHATDPEGGDDGGGVAENPEAGAEGGTQCPADPTWTGACPSVCTGGCVSNTCVIDCASGSACSGAVYCPGQLACEIQCSGSASCQNVTFYCSSAASCAIDCSGPSSCEGSTLYCNSKGCTASCTGTGARLGSKYCQGSCDCSTGGC